MVGAETIIMFLTNSFAFCTTAEEKIKPLFWNGLLLLGAVIWAQIQYVPPETEFEKSTFELLYLK